MEGVFQAMFGIPTHTIGEFQLEAIGNSTREGSCKKTMQTTTNANMCGFGGIFGGPVKLPSGGPSQNYLRTEMLERISGGSYIFTESDHRRREATRHIWGGPALHRLLPKAKRCPEFPTTGGASIVHVQTGRSVVWPRRSDRLQHDSTETVDGTSQVGETQAHFLK